MMSWRQLSFSLPDHLADAVSDRLDQMGAQAVTFTEDGDDPLYEPLPGETPLWRQTRATALFDWDTDTREIADRLQSEFPQLQHWIHDTLEDRAWERTWLEHFRPLDFGRLWICPSGQTPPDPGAVCLTLDPGLAFGTGTHPTTALCLEWLAATRLEGMRVIDYGCGSGILAIAALLLGAERAIACDIDPQALTATAENARKNRVAERLHCCHPDAMPRDAADVVVANILATPLVALAPHLTALTRHGGHLLLSGLLETQVTSVRQAYEASFSFEAPALSEGWARLHGLKY